MAINENKPLGIKWHKFLVFCLGLGSILNIIVGAITALTGIGVAVPSLAVVCVVDGALMIALAVFGFITRKRLKGFFANGPKLLVAYYIVSLVSSLFDTIAPAIVAPDLYVMDSSMITSAITGTIIAIAINASYYKKRADMFTN